MVKLNIPIALGGFALLVSFVLLSCGGAAKQEDTAALRTPSTSVSRGTLRNTPTPKPVESVTSALPTPSSETTAKPTPEEPSGGVGESGPSLIGLTGWINSDPFTLESQRGKVVLVDFWSLASNNSIRVFPYLKDWYNKYADRGLVILGVHSPEFSFESDRQNVLMAAMRYGLNYSIAQDNDFLTWKSFANFGWPARYLIDKNGNVRYGHIGEGAYALTEEKIRGLLIEAGADVSDITPNTDPDPIAHPSVLGRTDPEMAITRDLYAGFDANQKLHATTSTPPYIDDPQYYANSSVVYEYQDSGQHHNQFLYLNGAWYNGPESVIHARQTTDYEDYVALKFFSNSVSAVLDSASGKPFEMRVTLDNEPLDPNQAGKDVRFDDDGSSYVMVGDPRLYQLVKLSRFESHELKLSSKSSGMSVYLFSFGLYQENPIELAGITGWINSEPFTLESKHGNVVLVDFWTYSCSICQNTLDYTNELYKKYSDHGLVVLGVHTPEFEFEKKTKNVAAAVEKAGLAYPIALDNDSETWQAFNNFVWPTTYLLDANGFIRSLWIGEEGYSALEQAVRYLITQAGGDVSDIEVTPYTVPEQDPASVTEDVETQITRDLWTGTNPNYYGMMAGETAPYVRQDEYYQDADVDVLYEDPGDHKNHFIYLQGMWHNGPESLIHARVTENYEDYMVLKFNAKTVNVVLGREEGSPYNVSVTLDGEPLGQDQAGADVQFDESGNSYLAVDESRMYRLISLLEYGGHELKLSSNSDNFSVYLFTFGAQLDTTDQ